MHTQSQLGPAVRHSLSDHRGLFLVVSNLAASSARFGSHRRPGRSGLDADAIRLPGDATSQRVAGRSFRAKGVIVRPTFASL